MRAKRVTAILNVSDGAEEADKGVWLWVLVDDVDAMHRHCLEQNLEITWPPTDEPWGNGTRAPS